MVQNQEEIVKYITVLGNLATSWTRFGAYTYRLFYQTNPDIIGTANPGNALKESRYERRGSIRSSLYALQCHQVCWVVWQQELYSLGGRNIAVLSLPPLGCLPSQITLHGNGNQGCIQEFNDICLSFNKALIAQIDEMKANMPGSRLLYIDIYTYLNEVFHNPTPYGAFIPLVLHKQSVAHFLRAICRAECTLILSMLIRKTKTLN